MKNSGTAISATIVIALPSMIGCSCISDLIRTVSPKANPKPITSYSAARYQPGARSLARTGIRASPRGRGSGSCWFSLCHAREEVDERLNLRLRQGLPERLWHDIRAIPRSDEGVRLDDRLHDECLHRHSGLLGVGHESYAEVGSDGACGARGRERVT